MARPLVRPQLQAPHNESSTRIKQSDTSSGLPSPAPEASDADRSALNPLPVSGTVRVSSKMNIPRGMPPLPGSRAMPPLPVRLRESLIPMLRESLAPLRRSLAPLVGAAPTPADDSELGAPSRRRRVSPLLVACLLMLAVGAVVWLLAKP